MAHTGPVDRMPVDKQSGGQAVREPKNSDSRGLTRWIMLATGIWGSGLALGACLFGYDQSSNEVQFAPHLLRGLIVLAFVAAFLGGWGLLLAARNRPA